LAKAIEENTGIKAELIKSGGGVFEVEADGELIFSKKKEFRFPEDSEIINILKSGD
jgi:selT/selW/selH-like putative selenoprotein